MRYEFCFILKSVETDLKSHLFSKKEMDTLMKETYVGTGGEWDKVSKINDIARNYRWIIWDHQLNIEVRSVEIRDVKFYVENLNAEFHNYDDVIWSYIYGDL